MRGHNFHRMELLHVRSFAQRRKSTRRVQNLSHFLMFASLAADTLFWKSACYSNMATKSFSQYQQLGLHQPLISVMLEVHQCQQEIEHEMYTSGTCDNLVPPRNVLVFGPPRDAS